MAGRGNSDPSAFRSSRGRADRNPYVDKIHEYAPWTLTTDQAEAQRGSWRQHLGLTPSAPLLLEIGPGNGFFFRELAARRPEAGLVGLEVRFKRVWLTARKALNQDLKNFRVIHHHSKHIPDTFSPGELSAVYINHPDPWPKDRHHKHRLLQPAFGEVLREHLEPGGEVWVKSDFAPYGPLAREVFGGPGWLELGHADDLHGSLESSEAPSPLQSTAPEDSIHWAADIVTNYERKSLDQGRHIVLAGFRKDAG